MEECLLDSGDKSGAFWQVTSVTKEHCTYCETWRGPSKILGSLSVLDLQGTMKPQDYQGILGLKHTTLCQKALLLFSNSIVPYKFQAHYFSCIPHFSCCRGSVNYTENRSMPRSAIYHTDITHKALHRMSMHSAC